LKQEEALSIIKRVSFVYSGGNGIYLRVESEKERKLKIPQCVMRETGVNQLRVTKKLQKTYPHFGVTGKYKLKITHWFEWSLVLKVCQGQLDEGIEK
jgi:hypothetical protein